MELLRNAFEANAQKRQDIGAMHDLVVLAENTGTDPDTALDQARALIHVRDQLGQEYVTRANEIFQMQRAAGDARPFIDIADELIDGAGGERDLADGQLLRAISCGTEDEALAACHQLRPGIPDALAEGIVNAIQMGSAHEANEGIAALGEFESPDMDAFEKAEAVAQIRAGRFQT